MKKDPVFISFATQKGGVGKSTLTIFAASWLHYVKGVDVAVVDCDYPQHSVHKQKVRDMVTPYAKSPYHRKKDGMKSVLPHTVSEDTGWPPVSGSAVFIW